MSNFLIGRSRLQPRWHIVPMVPEVTAADTLPEVDTFTVIVAGIFMVRTLADNGDQYLEVRGVSHTDGHLFGRFLHQSELPTPEPGHNLD